MSVDSFKPEVWNAGLLSILDKSLVLGSVANSDYEGDISAYGDTVHVTAVDDVAISDYVPNTDMAAPETLDTTEQLITVDQAKSFHFYVDDVDARQVRNGGALLSEAGQRAAFGLRDKVDTFLRDRMAAGAGSQLGLIDASTTVANVYDLVIVPAGVELDEANVPEEMRWIAITPATYGRLQLDPRFIKANESGTGALHTGHVGDAGGFRIMKSNNLGDPSRTVASVTTVSGAASLTSATAGAFTQNDVGASVTGTGVGASAKILSVSADGKVATASVNSSASAAVTVTIVAGARFIAGSTIATTLASQILKTTAYSPERRFGDAVKGLHVYGGKVIRPEALVSGFVKNA